jgi:hypothetical protein
MARGSPRGRENDDDHASFDPPSSQRAFRTGGGCNNALFADDVCVRPAVLLEARGSRRRACCRRQIRNGDQSPLGELAAQASAEGYKVGSGLVPYHGYYYRILTQQGPNAVGGTLNYVVKGKMIGGFALVAYPAKYGNSGVMTFLVNHTGTVYQKDLGDNTLRLVTRMIWFDPDQTWKKASTKLP